MNNYLRLLAVVSSVCICENRADALVILDTVSDASYQNAASQFTASGRVNATRSTGSLVDVGSGTYLGDGWVLTAAHVVGDDPSKLTFRVGGVLYTADLATISIYPTTGNTDSVFVDDIAVFRLTLNPPIVPARFYDAGTVIGKTASLVGIGNTGTGSTGYSDGTLGTPRAGTNKIEGSSDGGKVLWADFDSPAGYTYVGGTSPYSLNTPTSLECQVAPGDSGGGWFLSTANGWGLVGITSGFISWGGGIRGTYGNGSVAVATAPYTTWMQSLGVPVVYASAVPEPGVTILLILGCIFTSWKRITRLFRKSGLGVPVLVASVILIGQVGCSRKGPAENPILVSQPPVVPPSTPARPTQPSVQQATDALKSTVTLLERMSGEVQEFSITDIRWGPSFRASGTEGGAMRGLLPVEAPTAGSTIYPAEIAFSFQVFTPLNRHISKRQVRMRVYYWVNAMGDLSAYPVQDL